MCQNIRDWRRMLTIVREKLCFPFKVALALRTVAVEGVWRRLDGGCADRNDQAAYQFVCGLHFYLGGEEVLSSQHFFYTDL